MSGTVLERGGRGSARLVQDVAPGIAPVVAPDIRSRVGNRDSRSANTSLLAGPASRRVTAGGIGAHDLVLLDDRSQLSGAGGRPLPDWAVDAVASTAGHALRGTTFGPRRGAEPEQKAAFAAGGWVVVRRDVCPPGLVPVGIRGAARGERFAAVVAASEIRRVIHPWQIDSVPRAGRAGLPALGALTHMREVMVSGSGLRWGPGGSVAHELVTGVPTVTPSSDLDVVIEAPVPLTGDMTDALLDAVESAPARVDAQVVTPAGGFALLEWVRPGGRRVALRTASGPVLTDNPWPTDN